MFERFIESQYLSKNIPLIHVKSEDFISIVDELADAIIFREYDNPEVRRILSNYSGDRDPDIFIIYNGMIVSTDAPTKITDYEEFKRIVFNNNDVTNTE
jgi:hypothetical protein